MLQVAKTTLNNYETSIRREWLETNGLGGWASSSVIGCNTRRYHGLLVAATTPPTERMALLAKLDETILTGSGRTIPGESLPPGGRFELGCNQYQDAVIHPGGYQYLQEFSKDLFPRWTYEAGGIRLKKTIAMVHRENTTLVLYEVEKAPVPFILELLPLISAKNYHSLQHASTNIAWDAPFEDGIFHNRPFAGAPNIYISVPGASYRPTPRWFYNFNYPMEIARGQDFEEDLFNHGILSLELREGDSLGIIISTENPAGRDAHRLLEAETLRRQVILTGQPSLQQSLPQQSSLHPSSLQETVRQLTLAADQFIVLRNIPAPVAAPTNSTSTPTSNTSALILEASTIIAGYHWFTDWSRDTMISLPGLCLTTGRHREAKKILQAFAHSVSQGMLPNRFQDNNQPPEYNNVDGTLWYFVAISQYLESTGDKDFILQEILPILKEIIDWHFKGTRYNIHVTEDGLLYAGEKGQQLTWMDARIGDWVVTPRMGKPVEIQALWYNALKIFSRLLLLNDQPEDAGLVEYSAAKAKAGFSRQFWYKEGAYLYDVIDETGKPDPSLRPNQLLAISLPYPLIEDDKARRLLKIVEEQLLTPVGLRSLSATDPKYIGRYGGNAYQRDSSYHQGTVWSWLLGPYIDALVRLDPAQGRQKAKGLLQAFNYHISEACIGSVSEIFDGNAPHHPWGCIAQAWGVAEILRVIKEYGLSD